MATLFDYIGKKVIVRLVNKYGHMLENVTGRVADVASHVKITVTMHKDLVYVVDIKRPDGLPYVNFMGDENEGWFAVTDVTIIEDGPQLFNN